MSICFDLSVGDGVVVQNSLEVGPVRRKVRKEHFLNRLQGSRWMFKDSTIHLKYRGGTSQNYQYLPSQSVEPHHSSIVGTQWSDRVRQNFLEGKQDLVVESTHQIPVCPSEKANSDFS